MPYPTGDNIGYSIDAPQDVVEDTTARTAFSLWKGIKNYVKSLAATISGGRVLVTPPATPSGEAYMGQVGGPSDVIDVVLTLDTNIYADGDVLLTATQEIANAARANGKRVIIQSITAYDLDDVGGAIDLIFAGVTFALGTVNAAPTIDDANAILLSHIVQFAGADWYDLGLNRMATKSSKDAGMGIMIETGAASRSIFVNGIARAASTYTANGLKLKLGILQLD